MSKDKLLHSQSNDVESHQPFIEMLQRSLEPVSEEKALEDFELLSSTETDVLWQGIYRELQADSTTHPLHQESREAALEKPTFWNWLHDWFFPMAAVPALAALLLWWMPMETSSTPGTSPLGRTGSSYNGIKSASKGAYLMLKTVNSAEISKSGQYDPNKVKNFVKGQSYKVGDAFLFRFLVTRTGFVTLLREDKNGRLEPLFPFANQSPQRYRAGAEVKLEYKGQQMLYVLDRSLQGTQRFLLVHSDKPHTFAKHRHDLGIQGRQLLEKADSFYVTVRKNHKR